jgi:hypothetical protein
MILGAFAYRSAKKRRLGEAKATTTRKVIEIVLAAILCVSEPLGERSDIQKIQMMRYFSVLV